MESFDKWKRFIPKHINVNKNDKLEFSIYTKRTRKSPEELEYSTKVYVQNENQYLQIYNLCESWKKINFNKYYNISIKVNLINNNDKYKCVVI